MEAKRLRLSAEEIANRLEMPQQTRTGWLARCPAHPDKSPSLSIKDGDKGFPLYYCYAGCGYEEIEAALGILPKSPQPPPAPRKPEPEPEEEPEAQPARLLTGRQLATPPDFYHQPHQEYMAKSEQYFPYLTDTREIWATVKRVDTPGKPKKIQPTTTLPAGLRPLYLLPQLLAQSELGAAVLVVEGERTAHAALAYLPDWSVTTSINGAASPHKSDWTPVEGRAVVVWPDHDAAGGEYAEKVAALCREAGASSISIVAVPADWPEKWDLADELPEGATADTVYELVLKAKLHEPAWAADFLTAEEIMLTPGQPVDWTIEGLLPAFGGLSVISGKPKAGKSTLARDLAATITEAGAWFGRKAKQGSVLYLFHEDKRPAVEELLPKLGLTHPELLRCFFGRRPANEKPQDWLGKIIAHFRPSFVVADTLIRLLQIPDINNYSQAEEALGPLEQMATDLNVHLLLTHHNRKSNEGDEGDEVGGSSRIFAIAETLLLAHKAKQGSRTLTSIQRQGVDLPQTPFLLDLENGRVIPAQQTVEDAVRSTAQEAVAAFFKGKGAGVPVIEAEVMEAIKGPKTGSNEAKRSALRQLVGQGDIAVDKSKKCYAYWLVDKPFLSSSPNSPQKRRGEEERSLKPYLSSSPNSPVGGKERGEERCAIDNNNETEEERSTHE